MFVSPGAIHKINYIFVILGESVLDFSYIFTLFGNSYLLFLSSFTSNIFYSWKVAPKSMLCRLIQYVEHDKFLKSLQPQRIWKYIESLEVKSNIYFSFCVLKMFCVDLYLTTVHLRYAGLRIQVSFGFMKVYWNLLYRNDIQ